MWLLGLSQFPHPSFFGALACQEIQRQHCVCGIYSLSPERVHVEPASSLVSSSTPASSLPLLTSSHLKFPSDRECSGSIQLGSTWSNWCECLITAGPSKGLPLLQQPMLLVQEVVASIPQEGQPGWWLLPRWTPPLWTSVCSGQCLNMNPLPTPRLFWNSLIIWIWV